MNQLDLNERVAVITGGTGGIGKAIAARFVASGAKVILWDRQPDALSAVVAETGSAAGDVVDVTDQASLARAAAGVAEQFGGIDILINAAGINGAIGPVESYPVELSLIHI